MTRKSILVIFAVLLLSAGLFYYYGGHAAPAGQQALVALTPQNFATLGQAFDAAKADVRVLALLSPT